MRKKRPDGVYIDNINPYTKIMPHIMPKRYDAMNWCKVEVSCNGLDRFCRAERKRHALHLLQRGNSGVGSYFGNETVVIQIASDADGRRYVQLCGDFVGQFDGKFLGGKPVQCKVIRRVDKGLVNAVHVYVLGAYVVEVHVVDVRAVGDVLFHLRFGDDVIDVVGDFKQAAAVGYAHLFEFRRHGKTNCPFSARGVGNHKFGGHGVKFSFGALDGGKKTLHVDAKIGVLFHLSVVCGFPIHFILPHFCNN